MSYIKKFNVPERLQKLGASIEKQLADATRALDGDSPTLKQIDDYSKAKARADVFNTHVVPPLRERLAEFIGVSEAERGVLARTIHIGRVLLEELKHIGEDEVGANVAACIRRQGVEGLPRLMGKDVKINAASDDTYLS